MRILLDTHIILWWLDDSKALSQHAKKIINDPNNHIVVSVATAWEICIKKSLGKLKAPSHLKKTFIENGFEILPIQIEHTEILEKLPDHHSDPFDRLLISQALSEKMIIITHDKLFKKYKNVDLIIV